ncbi:beta-lactamase-like protein [Trichoderma evansii]
MAHLPPLQVDTFVSPPTKINTGLSDISKQWWQSETSTLIHGPNNAVLCDPPVTIQQCTVLADWIDSILALYPSKKLQYIFITHAHGDHFFGAPILQACFSGVKIIATAKVVAGIPEQYAPEMYEKVWKVLFPEGQLSEQHVRATALPTTNEFLLDGHILNAYDVSADHADSSILHVSSLDLVVCGDVVYGDCHQYFVEANTVERRKLWLDALEIVYSLNPKILVASHKRASQIDGAYLVAATRKYIIDFDTLEAKCETGDWQTLYHKVKNAYPHRWNDYLLEGSCKAHFSIEPFGDNKVV